MIESGSGLAGASRPLVPLVVPAQVWAGGWRRALCPERAHLHRYVKELVAAGAYRPFVFSKSTAVGPFTALNMYPVMAGHELTAANEKKRHTAGVCPRPSNPWIWDLLKEQGYVTGYTQMYGGLFGCHSIQGVCLWWGVHQDWGAAGGSFCHETFYSFCYLLFVYFCLIYLFIFTTRSPLRTAPCASTMPTAGSQPPIFSFVRY